MRPGCSAHTKGTNVDQDPAPITGAVSGLRFDRRKKSDEKTRHLFAGLVHCGNANIDGAGRG